MLKFEALTYKKSTFAIQILKKIKMKKIYLTLGLGMLFAGANAQTTLKIKNPIKKGKSQTERNSTPNSVNQVASTIVCNTQYVAGTTMNLSCTYKTTNTDGEYVDFLSITLPAGITPTGLANTSNPFPNTEDAGGGLEALNPVVGQVITWGVDNNDMYGGIFSSAGISFTINVTVGAGVTGNQVATYSASGDGYGGATAGNQLAGSFTIYPAGAVLPDLKTTFVQTLNLTALNMCNFGMDTVVSQIKNLGTTTVSSVTVVYSVNGVAQPGTVVPGPLAPGDSAYVAWLPTFNFTPSSVYSLKAWTALAGDINTSNDTAALAFTNSISTALTSVTYTNGIESAWDYASLNRAYVSGDGYVFGPSAGTFHSGLQALFYTVPTTATLGVQEAMVILPCMDVVMGEIYRISFWKRINGTAASANGQTAVFTGLMNNAAAMTTVLKPYAPIATYATWIKDSVDYTAAATETRYFALGGKGAVTATSQINVRYDDINIAKVNLIGVKSFEAATNSFYPNPTTGLVNINATANGTVEIYNTMGQPVLSKSLVNGSNTIDISGLSDGMYSIHIMQNNTLSVGKIIKAN
jgi:hypothetical protein